MRFAIFGLGSSMYEGGRFCKPALDLEGYLADLGATCIAETGGWIRRVWTCVVPRVGYVVRPIASPRAVGSLSPGLELCRKSPKMT